MTDRSVSSYSGPLAWMVKNSVTANLLMVFLLVGGFLLSLQIKQEVFPDFEIDAVSVNVVYPGASPEEVEQGIILAVEEAVRGLDGVDEVTATAREGNASVMAFLVEGVDKQQLYQEIKQEVDRITTFPEEAEEPSVTLANQTRNVLSLQLYGAVPETVLREWLEVTRDRLLQHPEITQIELEGARELEVLVEISPETLRVYGLTLQGVADRIRQAAIESPGGEIKTESGRILLRTKERRNWAHEFGRLPIITPANGEQILLEEIAIVREGFEDANTGALYNDQRSLGLNVYRVGDQTPIGVSDAVKSAMAEIETSLPEGIYWDINNDSSDVYRQRLELLLRNAATGLLLVLCVLGLFLEFKLAFWVTMGILISFLGSFLFLPALGVSINMISMFAFIISLGIVVDDAIVAGENIYEYRRRGLSNLDAAIRGAKDVATPIGFSILTNIVAFLPLYFIPGFIGKIWKVIPMVVITVFIISWFESLFILPNHLAHTSSRSRNSVSRWLHDKQQNFSRRFSLFISEIYGPFLRLCLQWRGPVVGIGVSVLLITLAYVGSGRIGLILMPRTESDLATATATLAVDAPLSEVKRIEKQLLDGLNHVVQNNGGDELLKGYFSVITDNKVDISAYLQPPETRPLTTSEVIQRWRQQVPDLPELESLLFESDRGGPGSGKALTVELSHRDNSTLEQAALSLADRLAAFPVIRDIDDGFSPGKQQLDFHMRPEGESLGITARELAQQVRNAFLGAEALEQQRGRNEVTVRVLWPEEDRKEEYNLEEMLIRTPNGADTPLLQIADIKRDRAYTTIHRRDGRRTLNITANVEPIGETSRIQATLDNEILPQLAAEIPGLSYSYQGFQADMADGMSALVTGLALALLGVYFLLAIPFGSYTQPMIVMAAIPFGIVGAVLGHLLMGFNLSVMSLMGVVALSGVVINDSLVLIDYSNRLRHQGMSSFEAITQGAIRRFRPIVLTTLTTFGGLAPMIFETSMQARFMIPMALSLGFGIVFATVIILILIPCFYLLLEDVKGWFRYTAKVPELTDHPV